MSDELCGHRVRLPSGRTWVCVREPHDWDQDAVAEHRRQQGKVVGPDRHVMVRVGRA